MEENQIFIQAGTRITMNGVQYDVYSHLNDKLGSGDDGTVYVASTTFGPRAVKVIHKISKDSQNELWAVEKLVKNPHPFILRYFGTVRLNRGQYLAMELCTGSLSSPPEPPLHSGTVYLTQLYKALHHIHSMGIAHCDVCNINVLWKGDTGCEEIRLADFGWSRNRETEPHLDYEHLFRNDWINAGNMFEEMGWISMKDLPFFEKSRSTTTPMVQFERMFLEGITIS
jgi:serine/threonine protein kinase